MASFCVDVPSWGIEATPLTIRTLGLRGIRPGTLDKVPLELRLVGLAKSMEGIFVAFEVRLNALLDFREPLNPGRALSPPHPVDFPVMSLAPL